MAGGVKAVETPDWTMSAAEAADIGWLADVLRRMPRVASRAGWNSRCSARRGSDGASGRPPTAYRRMAAVMPIGTLGRPTPRRRQDHRPGRPRGLPRVVPHPGCPSWHMEPCPCDHAIIVTGPI